VIVAKKCTFDDEATSPKTNSFKPMKPKDRDIKPSNLFNLDPDYFMKGEEHPSLFNVQVDKAMFEHLHRDDLDEISKQEVVYMILKEQLRQQQKRLVMIKEKKRLKKHEKMIRSKAKRAMSASDLDKFAKQVKFFQLNSLQRDLPPVIKRVIENLTCQQHKFMYCPQCKDFNDIDFDPIENIQQFMKFVD